MQAYYYLFQFYFCNNVAFVYLCISRNMTRIIQSFKTQTHFLHKMGLWISMLCAIHCLAMPFLIAALPFISKDIISEQAEQMLLIFSAGMGLVILLRDYWVHRNPFPLVLLAISFVFNGFAFFVVHEHGINVWIILGALFLTLAYFVNWKKHKRVCKIH